MTTERKANVYCGVAFEFGGKEVALNPATAITEVKTKGLDCSLPGRVELGAVKDIFDDVTHALKADYTYAELKEAVGDIPILSGGLTLLGDGVLAVERFHLFIPPTEEYVITNGVKSETATPIAEPRTPDYDVGVSMTWGEGTGDLFGNIKLKGLFLRVSNMPA
ncbi:hypothetical protein EDC56_0678 [Sinobacterium caligoides]|uniref:Uncharacterized protein n=1 Tax=Sinobacterium caligoides TaxID=933926 RepID=A0A3N2E0B9_9GAMM|nr:hypothetical protein [Sinobacterium caligoides]ROS05149.1 hypothetical protein EDC56_0678 [Sinobacterium caligoides]